MHKVAKLSVQSPVLSSCYILRLEIPRYLEIRRIDFWETSHNGSGATLRNFTKLRLRRQRERLKHNRFYEQNNNVNFARASPFFVNFFADPEKLQREMTKC